MSNLNPITRKEAILNGDDITPVTREEHFAKKAVSGGGGGIPTPTAEDAGKVPTVGADGTVSWQTPSGGSGVPAPTSEDVGKVLTAIAGSQTATLVPEQTLTDVTANTPVPLSNSTFDGIEVGDTVHVTIAPSSISHDSFDGDVEVTSDGIEVMGESDVYTIYDSGSGIYFSSDYSLTGVTIEVTAEVAGEPTASWQTAGGGIPTPTSADKGKVLTVAEKISPQTIIAEYSATFDEFGITYPTITVDPTSIENGTIGTLHIGSSAYELEWSYNSDEGWGTFGDIASGNPTVGYNNGEWSIDNGPTSTTATVSMTADLPSGEMGAQWESGNLLLNFSDSSAVMTAVSNAVQAAIGAQDYLLHAGSSSKAFDIPSTSGVTANMFIAAVSAAIDASKPLLVSVESLGVFNATFFGRNSNGATAHLSLSSYDAIYGFVTILLELYVHDSAFKGNAYAQQIKMPDSNS